MFRDDTIIERLSNQHMYMSSRHNIIAEDVRTNTVKNRSNGTDEEIINAWKKSPSVEYISVKELITSRTDHRVHR
jgi:hypothetical protein